MPRNGHQDRIPGSVISQREKEQLELEVVSNEARLRLTRLLRARTRAYTSSAENGHQIEIVRQNRIINVANAVLGRQTYVLEMSDWDYETAEYGWHNGEFELALRRPDTPQLVEILADLLNLNALNANDVNAVLEADGAGFRFHEGDSGHWVEIVPLEDLAETATPDEHANVRQLFDRMDRAMQDKDWSLVLHTGASIFETVAKQVVSNPNVQNQSLGGWFGAYRNHSKLAVPLLDTIQEIFNRRNIEPLAGHGSTQDPSITEDEAIQVRVLTQALVRLERALAQ